MTGNTLGALKAKLTRHALEDLKLSQEYEQERRAKEIIRNKERWERAKDRLRKEYSLFNDWYDTDAIPEIIYWRGERFETVLKILRKKLKEVRQENKNETASRV